jgi:hypothetical protein
LSCFGASLAKARVVAFVLGLLGAMGAWTAGRWLGLSRKASLLGVIIGCALPYAAWLGVATTPDYFASILILLACSSLARSCLHIRTFGAAAIFVATLSRYEAWPVAATWAVFTSIEAVRSKNWRFAALVLLVLAAPLGWMLHGATQHCDALFFVKRVVGYRRALGVVDGGAVSHLVATPTHLLKDAPELWTIAAVSAIGALLRKQRPFRRHWLRPLLAVFSIAVFLIAGDWRDGAATHHVGRSLLPIWLFIGLLTAGTIVSFARRTVGVTKFVGFALVVGVYCFALVVLRPTWTKFDAFSPRIEETAIGSLASAKSAMGQRLAIDTGDYGYFAVQAAFAHPNDVAILDKHDPRLAAIPDAFASSATLHFALEQNQARWLVAQSTHEPCVSKISRIHFRGPTLLLAELR